MNNTLQVYAGDYGDSSEYVNSTTVNGISISSHCVPQLECGNAYYTCIANYDIGPLVANGQATILTTATSDVSYCGYNGYILYVKYTLQDTVAPTLSLGKI